MGAEEALVAVEAGDRTERRRRRGKVAPVSIEAFAKAKGYFSVSELVGPTWCEYSYQYGIFGLSSLPVPERPQEVVLPSGHTIKPIQELIVRKEQIQNRGREVHRKLEREIHPVQVYVQTKTKEDDWALRLLRLVVGLRSLLDVGCVRELPVFGWIQDHLVIGIIDEIERRPLRKAPRAAPQTLEDLQGAIATQDQSQTRLPFDAPMSVAFSGPGDTLQPPSVSNSPKGKVWASQAEWKAHQSKLDAVKKQLAKHDAQKKKRRAQMPSSPVASPSKKRAMKGNKGDRTPQTTPTQSKQTSLSAFLSGGGGQLSSQDEVAPASSTSTRSAVGLDCDGTGAPISSSSAPGKSQEGRSAPSTEEGLRPHGFFIVDTKTRMFPVIPPIEDQKAARLQTMLYKRLLDGLCLGALQRAQPGQGKIPTAPGSDAPLQAGQAQQWASELTLDRGAQAFDFALLFASLGLDCRRPLSKVFLEDSQELLDGIDLSNLLPATASDPIRPVAEAAGLSSLNDVAFLVDETLRELVRRATSDGVTSSRTEVGSPGAAAAAAVQDELSLVYRLQQRKGKWKRKRHPLVKSSDTSSGSVRLRNKGVTQPTQAIVISSDDDDDAAKSGEDEDARQLRKAIQLSLETQADLASHDGATTPPHASAEDPEGGRVMVASSPRRRKSKRLAARSSTEQQVLQDDAREARPSSPGEEQPAPGEAATAAEPSSSSGSRSSRSKRRSTSPSTSNNGDGSDSRVIGRVHFRSDPDLLSAHLASILLFYSGDRPARGVEEQETWKCKGCEWRDGCEWRAAKGLEKAQWAWDRRSKAAKKEEREGEGGGGGGGELDAQSEELARHEESAAAVDDIPLHVDNDEDAALWDQFGDDDAVDDLLAEETQGS